MKILSLPLIFFIELSLFNNIINLSQFFLASFKSCKCPECKTSKQPFVTPIFNFTNFHKTILSLRSIKSFSQNSSIIFWKISFVEFFSSINMNLPPKLVKFFSKIRSFVSSLEIADSISSESCFFLSLKKLYANLDNVWSLSG